MKNIYKTTKKLVNVTLIKKIYFSGKKSQNYQSLIIIELLNFKNLEQCLIWYVGTRRVTS